MSEHGGINPRIRIFATKDDIPSQITEFTML